MSNILIIEDNRDIAEGLRRTLEVEGYTAEVALDGEQGLARLAARPPRLVILDLMLPRVDGFHVLRRLRDAGHEMPVLILSARGDEVDKVRGFRIGADDYVTKPFGLRELLARVDALFRRQRRLSSHTAEGSGRAAGAADVARFGDVEVRLGSRTVLKRGAPVALRPKELDLLRALIERAGVVSSRRELLEVVWEYDPAVRTRTVDTHVLALRRKLEDDPTNPRYIVTARKAGYMLRLEGAP